MIPLKREKNLPLVTSCHKISRNTSKSDKEAKIPPTKPSIVPEKESDNYSDSSSRALSDKFDNNCNISPNRRKCHLMIYLTKEMNQYLHMLLNMMMKKEKGCQCH